MKPATPYSPLPWRVDGYMILDGNKKATFANERYYPWVEERDFPYIVHACNAYPRLVAELKRLCVEIPKQLGSDKPFPNNLLRELGEDK